MSIKYEVFRNGLTHPATFAARIRPAQNVRLATLVSEISAETSLAPSDIQAVVTNLISRVQEELTRGNSVTIDGLVTFGTSLTARIDTMTDPLPKDAKLNVSTRAHPALAGSLRQKATLERVTAPSPGPVLLYLNALFGDKRGIGCGDVMELKGERLRFDPDQEDAGVFFTDSGTNMEYRAKNYIDIEEKRLTFLVPKITGYVKSFL
jgi:nucleoid DNA-binding protein